MKLLLYGAIVYSFFRPWRPLLLGWLLSFLAWGLVVVVVAAYAFSQRGDAWTMHLLPGLRFWLPWALSAPLLFRFVARYPVDRQHWPVRLAIHLAVCVVVIGGIHFLRLELFRSFLPPPGPGPAPAFGELPPPPLAPGGPQSPRFEPGGPRHGPHAARHPFHREIDYARMVGAELPTYLAIVTGAHALFFFRRDQERGASLARARLDALRMQLQPHFLFNTLNTIGGLIHENPDKADELVHTLGDLLRRSLETSSDPETTLEREIEFAEHYLELMHARFEERLRYEFDVAPAVRRARVPTMLLHPLVENAVEHGIQPKPEGGRVVLRAWREGDKLRLTVIDDGVGLDRETPLREGIGLGNTRTRLRELYGEEGHLTLRGHGGTIVEVTLPFRTESTAG